MSNEFSRGKIIITATVGVVILLNSMGIWFNQNRLLKWYAELAQTLTDQIARDALRELQTWFLVNQGGIFSNQWLNYSVIIFLCLMLYLGYDWSRWFWAIYWLAGSIVGAFVSTVTWAYLGHFDRLLAISYTVSAIYLICGITIVASRSVRTYMRTMRYPAGNLNQV